MKSLAIVSSFLVLTASALPFNEQLNREIERVSLAGGGRVTVPAGEHESGTIVLKSNVELHLEPGAVILGSGDCNEYPLYHPVITHSQKDVNGWCALIYAEGATNIALTGTGTIDGRGALQPSRTRIKGEKIHDLDGRSRNLLLVSCRGVTVKDVLLKNPAMWNQHYFDCEDVLIDSVKVFARVNYNNDAIDIDACRRVVIRNCNLDAEDDGIVFKNTTLKPCEDILVEDCRISSQATAVKFGTESLCGFKRVRIRNIVVRPSEIEAEFMHPCKLPKGISAVEVSTVDGADIEDIDIDGVDAVGVGCAVYLRVGDRGRPIYKDVGVRPAGKMRRVRVANVLAREIGNFCSQVTAFEPGHIEDVVLENIDIETLGGVREGNFCPAAEFVDQVKKFPSPHAAPNRLVPAKGLFLRNAGNVKVVNFKFRSLREDVRPERLTLDSIP